MDPRSLKRARHAFFFRARHPRWRFGPPDFVGIGQQRSGTTRWFRLLTSHPQIIASPWASRGILGKETHFFDRDRRGGDGPWTYHLRFPRPPHALIGEWTPDYLYRVMCLEPIARAAPDTKFLLLLRDPLDRLRSGLAWQNIEEEALERGLYARQLRPWLERFPREQFLIQQFERTTGPHAPEELARAFRFLGVEPIIPPTLNDRVGYWTKRPTRTPSPALLDRARAAYSQDIEELRTICPDFDFDLWPLAPN